MFKLIEIKIKRNKSSFEPAHEIMVLFALYKHIHAQPSSGARCLIFGRTLRLLPYFMCANSEGSGETRGCTGWPEPSLVAYVIST